MPFFVSLKRTSITNSLLAVCVVVSAHYHISESFVDDFAYIFWNAKLIQVFITVKWHIYDTALRSVLKGLHSFSHFVLKILLWMDRGSVSIWSYYAEPSHSWNRSLTYVSTLLSLFIYLYSEYIDENCYILKNLTIPWHYGLPLLSMLNAFILYFILILNYTCPCCKSLWRITWSQRSLASALKPVSLCCRDRQMDTPFNIKA